ncbi:uncharacterized protein LAESUDRAFT_666786, partial [Laetiporus sulphureus 93-53]
EITPSVDFIRNATTLRHSTAIVKSMRILSLRVNAIIKAGDPRFYKHAVVIREKMEKDNTAAELLGSIDPLVLEGREILVNSQSSTHVDRYDPILAWVIIVALGNFKGGHIYFPSLGLKVRLLPGDAVMMRGRILPHKVEDWEGTQRISIPHFTHLSIWKKYGMANDVSA